jgi:hypothetical protein
LAFVETGWEKKTPAGRRTQEQQGLKELQASMPTVFTQYFAA